MQLVVFHEHSSPERPESAKKQDPGDLDKYRESIRSLLYNKDFSLVEIAETALRMGAAQTDGRRSVGENRLLATAMEELSKLRIYVTGEAPGNKSDDGP